MLITMMRTRRQFALRFCGEYMQRPTIVIGPRDNGYSDRNFRYLCMDLGDYKMTVNSKFVFIQLASTEMNSESSLSGEILAKRLKSHTGTNPPQEMNPGSAERAMWR